jgi:hypothetical protein
MIRGKFTDCIVVGVCEEIFHASFLHLFFIFIHQSGSVASDLLSSCDREEDNLGKFLTLENAEADASNDLGFVFHDDHGFVLPVKQQLDYIFLRHFRQLSGDDVLQVNHQFHMIDISKDSQTLR